MIITNYSRILLFLVIAIITIIAFTIFEHIVKMQPQITFTEDQKKQIHEAVRRKVSQLQPIKPRGEPVEFLIKNGCDSLTIFCVNDLDMMKSQAVSLHS